jgi:hypothetical protein
LPDQLQPELADKTHPRMIPRSRRLRSKALSMPYTQQFSLTRRLAICLFVGESCSHDASQLASGCVIFGGPAGSLSKHCQVVANAHSIDVLLAVFAFAQG